MRAGRGRALTLAAFGLALGLQRSAAAAGLPAHAIVGEWWTQGKDARVEFSRARDGTYLGVLRHGGRARRDVHNPDPARRNRPLVGSVLMWNLRHEDGEYVDGFVYNPEDGNTYRVKAWLTSARELRVRGFVGISLFGQTHTWSRYR